MDQVRCVRLGQGRGGEGQARRSGHLGQLRMFACSNCFNSGKDFRRFPVVRRRQRSDKEQGEKGEKEQK